MRTQNVLSLMGELARKNPGTYREEAVRELVGRSLITKYNNKAYRVSLLDLVWLANELLADGFTLKELKTTQLYLQCLLLLTRFRFVQLLMGLFPPIWRYTFIALS